MQSIIRAIRLTAFRLALFSLHVSLYTFPSHAHAQSLSDDPAGTATTIRLISPNGGEVFVSGSDTVVVWDGMPACQSVTVECSTDAGRTWTPVAASVTGSRCAFRVPVTTVQRDSCLVRLITRKSTARMVSIPAGTFWMGNVSDNPNGWEEEKPVHQVTISRSFLVGCTEVTQAEWKAVMGTDPSSFKGDKLPVEQVSWYDAVAYCNRLSQLEGFDTCYTGSGSNLRCDFAKNGYRLPTEAEWEYACRGGATTDYYTGKMVYSGHTPLDSALDMAGWYVGNAEHSTHNVRQKQPNAHCLYDMHGNVEEWCWDWYTSYQAKAATDPRGPVNGQSRLARGGSWNRNALSCRSCYRGASREPDFRWSDRGFRVARTE